jgi:hypothetical protein
VSTVGLDEETIRAYIRNQEAEEKLIGDLEPGQRGTRVAVVGVGLDVGEELQLLVEDAATLVAEGTPPNRGSWRASGSPPRVK